MPLIKGKVMEVKIHVFFRLKSSFFGKSVVFNLRFYRKSVVSSPLFYRKSVFLISLGITYLPIYYIMCIEVKEAEGEVLL